MAADAPHDLALPPRARVTPQRQAVLDAIAAARAASRSSSSTTGPARPSRGSGSRPSTARSSSCAHRLDPAARHRRRPTYVRCHAGHHHHLVCTVCGAVEETELCAAPSAAELRTQARLPAQRRIRSTSSASAGAARMTRSPGSPSRWRADDVSTIGGGFVALRVRRSSTTLIALTGGIVVAVALFDVLPEAIDAVGNEPQGDLARRRGLPRVLPRRARARAPSPRRRRARARAHSRIGVARRGRALRAQLHRRARDRRSPSRSTPRPACSSSSPSSHTTSPTG